jgi:hypothetical protein
MTYGFRTSGIEIKGHEIPDFFHCALKYAYRIVTESCTLYLVFMLTENYYFWGIVGSRDRVFSHFVSYSADACSNHGLETDYLGWDCSLFTSVAPDIWPTSNYGITASFLITSSLLFISFLVLFFDAIQVELLAASLISEQINNYATYNVGNLNGESQKLICWSKVGYPSHILAVRKLVSERMIMYALHKISGTLWGSILGLSLVYAGLLLRRRKKIIKSSDSIITARI